MDRIRKTEYGSGQRGHAGECPASNLLGIECSKSNIFQDSKIKFKYFSGFQKIKFKYL